MFGSTCLLSPTCSALQIKTSGSGEVWKRLQYWALGSKNKQQKALSTFPANERLQRGFKKTLQEEQSRLAAASMLLRWEMQQRDGVREQQPRPVQIGQSCSQAALTAWTFYHHVPSTALLAAMPQHRANRSLGNGLPNLYETVAGKQQNWFASLFNWSWQYRKHTNFSYKWNASVWMLLTRKIMNSSKLFSPA